MIRFIAALDKQNGIANENGIPWQGKLPTDVAWFREKTLNSNVLMGYGWYKEQEKPLPNRKNFVAYPDDLNVREGFVQVKDAREFLKSLNEDIWVGGGAAIFANTLDLADELYITRLDTDFSCTKFFPEFEDKFQLVSETPEQTENGISFSFQIWKRI